MLARRFDFLHVQTDNVSLSVIPLLKCFHQIIRIEYEVERERDCWTEENTLKHSLLSHMNIAREYQIKC